MLPPTDVHVILSTAPVLLIITAHLYFSNLKTPDMEALPQHNVSYVYEAVSSPHYCFA